MITRIRPLDLNLAFQDRPYKLGETINIKVELRARGDVLVREGRVNLVCEERYTEIYTVMVPAYRVPPTTRVGTPVPIPIPNIPKQVSKEHRETYVYSSVVFLQDTTLNSGTTGSYNARLEIQPEPPPHAENSTLKWMLVTAVDVAQARDVTKKQRLKVTLV